MTWVKLDDGFYRHPKARAVGRDGRELFLAACCWSAANLTDGHIPPAALTLIAGDAEVSARKVNSTVEALLKAGMWDANGDGWVIHDYLDFNPSRARVEADRERWREHKRRRDQ